MRYPVVYGSQPEVHFTRTVLKLIIEDDEGRKTVVPFVREEITIGRQTGNTVQLTERNVSRKHARFLKQNGSVILEDLGSYNGTRINGAKVQGRAVIATGDLIQIGDYDLAIQSDAVQPGVATPAVEPPPTTPVLPPALPKKNGTPQPVAASVLAEPAPPDSSRRAPHSEPPVAAPPPARREQSPTDVETETDLDSSPPLGLPLWKASLAVAVMGFLIGAVFVWSLYGTETPKPEPTVAAGDSESSSEDAESQAKDRALVDAQAAYSDRDFARAVQVLEQAHFSPEKDEEMGELMQRARMEAAAAQQLAAAEREVAAGKWPKAQQILENVKTQELADLRNSLLQRTRNVRSKGDVASSKGSTEEAQALYDEGKTLFQKQQYSEAQTLFAKCLEVDPNYAHCHMMLGSTFAKMGEPELGAKHYRQFVKLAPGDSQAPKVKSFLNQYDESKRRNR